MTVEKIGPNEYRLTCEAVGRNGEPCKHQWTSDHIPDRCARCKRFRWNYPDSKTPLRKLPPDQLREYNRLRQAESRQRRAKPKKKKIAPIELPKPKRVRSLDA